MNVNKIKVSIKAAYCKKKPPLFDKEQVFKLSRIFSYAFNKKNYKKKIVYFLTFGGPLG